MLWARNVLFLTVVGGGLLALAINILPPREPAQIDHYNLATHRDANFHETVDRVNTSFRQEWLSNDFKPAKPALGLLVARRLSLGLMGTVPSLEEIRQFEALPPEQRIPWWVDHIVQDPRFADYFGERFARSYVGVEGGPFIFYRRRRFVTWVSQQIAANRPYDQLVRELVAGEGLWTDHPATNFVSVTVQNEKKNQPDPERLAGRVTRAFLGLRLDCAQCHNHPYAEWKQTDFHGLAAFFGQTQLGFTGIRDRDGEYMMEDKVKNTQQVVQPGVPFAPELLPDKGNRRERLAAWITHPSNPYFARATVNRVWALMFGKPLVEPVDNLEPGIPIPAALQILADDFAKNGFDLRRLIRLIASTEVFRMDSATEHEVGDGEEKAWAVFPLTRLRPEQVAGSVLQASSVSTLDAETHIIIRLTRQQQLQQFVQRYGDTGEDEFQGRGGTIPQRLLLMNGELVRDRIGQNPLNAIVRISVVAGEDSKAIETVYLAALSRGPTPEEAAHFEKSLREGSLSRAEKLEDLYWALINSTEFSWNH